MPALCAQKHIRSATIHSITAQFRRASCAGIARPDLIQKAQPLDFQIMHRGWFLSLAPLILSLGCGSSIPTCEETAHLYDINHSLPSGLSGKNLAQHAVGVHPVELTVSESAAQLGRVTPAFPNKTPGTLTITLAPGAQWSHVISEYVPCDRHNCADLQVYCTDFYSVPVTARLTAFNGSIDETWQGELRANDPNDPDAAGRETDPHGGVASISMIRDASTFVGSLKVTPEPVPSGETVTRRELQLSASFTDGAMSPALILERVEREQNASNADAGMFTSVGPVIQILPAPLAQ